MGLVLAWIAREFVETLLFGVAPSSAASLLVPIALLASAGLMASLVPAYRAARLNLATRLPD